MSLASAPTIVFGAFDRHNFGDLLFAHVAQALLQPQPLLFAGLAGADLRADGGHRLQPVRTLSQELQALQTTSGGRPPRLIHAGGEILDCDAWQAAVMLLPPQEAQQAIARHGGSRQAQLAWAREQLGMPDLAPYVAGRALFPDALILHNAVGGADLVQAEPALRAEVEAKLRQASAIAVRDARTAGLLAAAGIDCMLLPDPACLVAELFEREIGLRLRNGVAAAMRQAFPHGYLAVQFSADFGDDASLLRIAVQLDRLSAASGFGIVLFMAGAATWHDELCCLQRAAQRMAAPARVQVAQSLFLWDICALIAGSRGYLGSSLHGRIVAMAHGLPRLNLLQPGTRPGKHAAYAATWDAGHAAAQSAAQVEVQDLADGMLAALGADPVRLRREAHALATTYRRGFASLGAALA